MLAIAQRVMVQADELTPLVKAYTSPERVALPVYIDTETTGLNPRTDKLICIQVKQAEKPGVVIDMRRDWKSKAVILAPLFNRCSFVGHNIKFDYNFLAYREMTMRTVWDTKLAEHVIYGLGGGDARIFGKALDLKSTLFRRLGVTLSKELREWYIGLDLRLDEWNAPLPEEQVNYALEDIEHLPALLAAQLDELEKWGVKSVADLEMRALPGIAQMELAGIRIDVDGWREFIKAKGKEATNLADPVIVPLGIELLKQRQQEYSEADTEHGPWTQAKKQYEAELKSEWMLLETDQPWGKFKIEGMKQWRAEHPEPTRPRFDTSLINVDSSTQVLSALQSLGVPVTSTNSTVLKDVEDAHPIVKALVKYRKAQKFVTSFGEPLLAKVDPADERIHPEYQPIGASTGRMSCSNPNWQQVPSRGDGKKLRKLVIAAPKKKLITADFSNIELRILAAYSQDANMLKFFAEEKDLHSETAKLMFNLPDDTTLEALKDSNASPVPGWSYRDIAKTINFGLVYGMSAKKLSRTLKVSLDEASRLMSVYFTTYPGVNKWLDKQAADGVRDKRVETMSGRKRYLHWGMGAYLTRGQQGRIERQAKNTPIQGTSADITKLAIALWHENYGNAKDARLVLAVHDELGIEVDEKVTAYWAIKLSDIMDQAQRHFLEGLVTLPAPVAVISNSWEH